MRAAHPGRRAAGPARPGSEVVPAGHRPGRRRGAAHLARARQRRGAGARHDAVCPRQPDVVLPLAPLPRPGAGRAGGCSRSTSWGWASPSAPTEPRRFAQRVDDLAALTAALGVTGPVVTVGHDWGGPISLGWALAHRDQLRGVVLTNTAVHQPADRAVPPLIRLARTPLLRRTACATTPTFVRAAGALSRPPLPADVRRALAAPYRRPRGGGRRRLRGGHPAGADHPSRDSRRVADAAPDLADVPALLLWGPRDPVFSERYLRDLRDRLPHAQVHRYESASHLVTEDAPECAAARVARGSDGAALPRRPEGAPGAAARRLWAALDGPRATRHRRSIELGRRGRRSPSTAGAPGARAGRRAAAAGRPASGTGSRCWCRRAPT